MSSESVPPVEAPPAATEQNRAAEVSADNVSSAQLRQALRSREDTRATQATVPAASVAATEPTAQPESTTEKTADVPAKTDTAPTETTAPAAQTEPAETSDESDDVLSQLSSLDPKAKQLADKVIADYKAKQQDSIDKRIAKERAKRGDLERQLQELQLRQLQPQAAPQQTVQTPAAPPVPVAGIPLSHINSPQELVTLQKEAKDTIRFVERALDRDDIDQGIQVGNQVFTKKDLKERMYQAKEVLEDQIPQRAAFLQQRDQSASSAFEKFPFYKDPKSPEFARAQAIIRNAPAIQNAPNYLEIVGKLVLGEIALEQRDTPSGGAKPAAVRAKPPADQTVSGASGGGSERLSPGSRAAQTLATEREKMVGSGNVSAQQLRQFLKRSDQLRNSR